MTAAERHVPDRRPAPVVVGFFVVLLGLVMALPAAGAEEGAGKPAEGVSDAKTEPAVEDWNAHFEYTGILQGNVRFRAPYSGPNSLNPGNRMRELMNFWGFFGTRLWEGGEFYVNTQFEQGFGLNKSVGLAGFPNGEAQKAGFHTPKFNVARTFLRQTFGFGGEQENLESDAGQLAGPQDISRLTITAGKFSPTDLFDRNAYSHDSRGQFMNYALADTGTFDWGADQKGYSGGVAVELNQKDWAARVGHFMVPQRPNTRDLNIDLTKYGMPVAELEERHELFSAPGKLRLMAFGDHAYMGKFSDALAIAGSAAPDVVPTRKYRWKYGIILNLEQAITDEVGIFSRLGWNDGQTEALTYAEIDRTAAAGVSIRGAAWERPADVVGFGGAINGLSKPHRQFLAAGGIGNFIGDGALNYGTERPIETYYKVQIVEPLAVTFDYQFFVNPAYNRDRGPVSIFALRAHLDL